MAKLSDLIEEFICRLLDETTGVTEIQRNELANRFHCVPSQINYVLSTRFTKERGYYVESRRGGGGYISIKKVTGITPSVNYLMHTINSIGGSISYQLAEVFINNFVDYNIISAREAFLLKAALSSKVMDNVPFSQRNTLRASILKNMLLSLLVKE